MSNSLILIKKGLENCQKINIWEGTIIRYSRAVVFNLFDGAELQSCVPVVRGIPVHISTQKI